MVIEDDLGAVDVIEASLREGGMTAVVATSGAEGLLAVRHEHPDVVLLDLELPDRNGIDLIAEIAAEAAVIVVTGTDDDDVIVTAFERGADDYVTKPFSPRVLSARVTAAARRVHTATASVIEHGRLVIDLDRRIAVIDGGELDFTRRELDLLAHLASRAGVVVTREELLESVWRSSAEWQTTATITEHVRRVRHKLGDERWIVNVRGVGYRFEPLP